MGVALYYAFATFQFLLGRLKTGMEFVNLPMSVYMFQFLLGRLKTPGFRYNGHCKHIGFNSC
mgnify:CR=1 FL=1